MLVLEFEGWFQLRMATDPDPTDEPRGLSGYTFALPGEPDFDGLMHLQPGEAGVHERRFGPSPDAPGPRVGVTVRAATRNGAPVSDLIGATVAFPDARLVERNGLVVRNDYFAVDPLRVTVTSGCVVILDRGDWLDPSDPGLTIDRAGSAALLRRQPTTWTRNSSEVAAATGLPVPVTDDDLVADRRARQANLRALLAVTPDPEERAGLETRIAELDVLHQWWNQSAGQPIDRRAYTRALQASGWSVAMNGPITVNDVGADPAVPWTLAFWLGGWDGDALAGYIKGSWSLPLV